MSSLVGRKNINVILNLFQSLSHNHPVMQLYADSKSIQSEPKIFKILKQVQNDKIFHVSMYASVVQNDKIKSEVA